VNLAVRIHELPAPLDVVDTGIGERNLRTADHRDASRQVGRIQRDGICGIHRRRKLVRIIRERTVVTNARATTQGLPRPIVPDVDGRGAGIDENLALFAAGWKGCARCRMRHHISLMLNKLGPQQVVVIADLIRQR
jgi:hypothetical protein